MEDTEILVSFPFFLMGEFLCWVFCLVGWFQGLLFYQENQFKPIKDSWFNILSPYIKASCIYIAETLLLWRNGHILGNNNNYFIS